MDNDNFQQIKMFQMVQIKTGKSNYTFQQFPAMLLT